MNDYTMEEIRRALRKAAKLLGNAGDKLHIAEGQLNLIVASLPSPTTDAEKATYNFAKISAKICTSAKNLCNYITSSLYNFDRFLKEHD
ncbi:MAG TPA: hypothetical protein ENF41_00325 [Candidatus Bathyarchaeota archaeon]|nr:hypothetical protein [Candidatus Bathyarchaeota archaeon]